MAGTSQEQDTAADGTPQLGSPSHRDAHEAFYVRQLGHSLFPPLFPPLVPVFALVFPRAVIARPFVVPRLAEMALRAVVGSEGDHG